MKLLFRILRWCVFILIVLIIVGVLSFNTILKALTEKHIRDATGMDAEIGDFSFGLLTPTMTLRNLRIYSSPDFGGMPFLNIPELHVDYDRAALRKHQLHITLLRFNLDEIDIVKNHAGQTNIFSILSAAQINPNGPGGGKAFTQRTGLHFAGIDVLNISIGKAKFIDLADQKKDRTLPINIQNFIVKNVKSPTDLAGLAALIYLRGGYMVGLPGGPQQPQQQIQITP
jgi:hypothetical protein